MILDVGCGKRPQGDVNTDLYVRETAHRNMMGKIDSRHIKDFVCCDAQHLPFRDEVFDLVYSNHVIEHVENPFIMVREMLRVSSYEIKIVTPHRFFSKKHPFHKHCFNRTWFIQTLRRMGINSVYTCYSDFWGFPHLFLGLFHLPSEITVQAWKDEKWE